MCVLWGGASTGAEEGSMTEDKAPEFAPCPLCKQYSHSIGDDELTAAWMHFHTMIAHPMRGHPMGHAFDEKTRDAAQVLMAAARSTALVLAPEGRAG
jgi:hypothetical protein